MELPADEVPKVKRKLRAAWKRVNPDKDEDEMPESIKATETADWVEEAGAALRGESHALGNVEGAAMRNAEEATAGEKPSRAYLTRLWQNLRDSVSRDEFDKAARSARGHAGGKARAAKAKQHAEQHPEPVAGCEYCAYGVTPGEKLPKADEAVNYRPMTAADDGERRDACGSCRFYSWGSCSLVEGTIEADQVCDLYTAPPKTYLAPAELGIAMSEAAGDGGEWRLFNELASYAEPPAWIPYLPVPGTYTHQSYGKIAVTPERNKRFIDQFKAGVYQTALPIDAEHETKLSGAFGWITDMRLNDDGSVDAKADWTDRGKRLLEGDRFKYFSPEFFPLWTDPVDEQVYQDVAVGGAITTRPFFKERALRPLVASEDGHLYAADVADSADGGGSTVITFHPLAGTEPAARERTVRMTDQHEDNRHEPETNEQPTNASVTLTEAEAQAYREYQAKLTERESELADLRSFKDSAESRIAAMERDDRRKRFTDIVLGRANGSDGAAWPGEVEKNVGRLERFAEVYGEDSDAFRAEIEANAALAAQLKQSQAFTAIGSDGTDGGTIISEVRALAEQKREANASLSPAQAEAAVFAERPELYDRYLAER